MKLYIAARYDRLEEINQKADELRALGHVIDCRWLNGSHQLHPSPEGVDADSESVPMEARPFAEDDVSDLFASEGIVLFSEPSNSHSKRGGRHVEFGIALALRAARGKCFRLFVIGPRENVFHCLAEVERYFTWDEFKSALRQELPQ